MTANPVPQTPRKIRVLLVEDNLETRSVLKSFFESQNVEVHDAKNGAVARNLLDRIPFDLVLSDLRMPLGDGLSLLEHTKSLSPNTKYVLMSGFFSQHDMERARSAGADILLTKPFSPEDLRQTLQSCGARPTG